LQRNTIVIYDTTLRDGEQTPGVSFTKEQKLDIARKLDDARINQIEAGFPCISKEEQNIVKSIANEGLIAEILCLSRLNKNDIDISATTNVDKIILFVGTSDIHLKYKLHTTIEEVKERMMDCIDYAKQYGPVIMGFEDSTRTDIPTLINLSKAAEECGAVRIGIADTVGCATPIKIKEYVRSLKNEVKIPLSLHLHNDLGLVTANAFAGLEEGCKIYATTVNGIGERAGNLPLEQLALITKLFYDTTIDTTKLYELSQTVSRYSNVPININQPIVGDNAFAHEAGIHVSAINENPNTYEYISPEMVGHKRKIVLGKHSGRKSIEIKLKELGLEINKDTIPLILNKVKDIGQKEGIVTNERFKEIAYESMEI